MSPEVTIYYQESKPVDEPGIAYYRVEGRDLVGLNGSGIAHSGKELEGMLSKLADDNSGLIVRNRVPHADILEKTPGVTLLEVSYGKFTNRFRPLTPEEMPESVRSLVA